MNETITQRRAEIETAVRARLPDVAEFDRYRDGVLSIGRPRTHGQVFLALVDGLGADARPTERHLPIAAALELASLQGVVHRSTCERVQTEPVDYDPTRDILRGDLLESTAFETMLSFDAPAVVVDRCFRVLVRTSRELQEGYAMVADADVGTDDGDAAGRLGALTGGAVELATIVADVEDAPDQLVDHGREFGYRMWRQTTRVNATSAADPITACRRQAEALADCCPGPGADRVRRQLNTFLETSAHPDEVNSTA